MKQIRLFRTKKAVSPLIATVLLIAFAVALGAVVMNWGRNYIETTAEFAKEKSDTEIRCSMDISLELIRLTDTPQICFTNDTDNPTINFTVGNAGTVTITGIRMQVFGVSGIVTQDLNVSLSPASVYRGAINYSEEGNGTIQQVRFVPEIKVGGNDILCAKNHLLVEEIDLC